MIRNSGSTYCKYSSKESYARCIFLWKVYVKKGHPSPMVQQPLVGQGLVIIEASQSHADTPRSVGLLWMSTQPDTETST